MGSGGGLSQSGHFDAGQLSRTGGKQDVPCLLVGVAVSSMLSSSESQEMSALRVEAGPPGLLWVSSGVCILTCKSTS